jgi:hypothetical protein
MKAREGSDAQGQTAITCPFGCGAYDEELGILVCRPTGVLSNDNLHDIAVCRECLEAAGRADVNRFHDLTKVKGVNLHFEDLRKIADRETRFRQGRPTINACYWVPNPLLYGTIRMYQALMETRGVQVYVSYDLPELAAILNVDPSRLGA